MYCRVILTCFSSLTFQIPYNLLHFDELLLRTFIIGALQSSSVSICLHFRIRLLYMLRESMTHQKCTVLGPTSEFHSCANRDWFGGGAALVSAADW